MRLYLTLTLCLLALAACSATTEAPLSPQSTGLELANGVQRTLLSDLSYSGTEVGGGATFSFDLPSGLSGVFSDLVSPAAIDQPCWFKFVTTVQPQWLQGEEPIWVPGEEPNWDHGEQPDWVQGVQPIWIQGAGLIRETPFPGELLGLGTIEVPVTGTETENGQVIAVEGTLVIMLAEHVVEPKQGSYFNVCGTECVRFSLQAFFFPVGGTQPCWIEGMLTAQDA
jgi:hypothetical protein